MDERNGAFANEMGAYVAEVPTERLEVEITALGAHLAAATCRWLLLVGEFDRRQGWWAWGCNDCAHYLNWKCGVDRRTAREQVRVARALPGLPKTREAFSRGDLSYSKVRAITRVGTPENEETLVEWARHGTTAHLEKIVRAYRGVLRAQELEAVNERHARRYARWHHDDDGSLVFSARLDPEAGALLLAALEAMGKGGQGGSAEPPFPREDLEALRADALLTVAAAALAAQAAEHPVPEVVVHVDLEVLAGDMDEGRCELADGQALAPETARRLACDAGVVTVVEDGEDNPLHVGRRRRTPPSALRRALASRDGGCRFPGCGARRFLHAHHVLHWGKGGETELPNLVTLCSKHHRMVHEGRFTCEAAPERAGFIFRRPDGRLLETEPFTVDPIHQGRNEADCRLGLDLAADAGRCLWAGERLDLGMAVEGLLLLDGRYYDDGFSAAVAREMAATEREATP